MNTLKKLALLALSLPLAVFGYGGTYTENGVTYSYTMTSNTGLFPEACVSIASCGDAAEVVIPTSIGAETSFSLMFMIVTSIGQTSWNCWEKIASVDIPLSVTSIGESAFSGCSSLTSVTIPYSVTSIGAKAFNGCSSLTSVTIPNGVTSIDEKTFYGCSSLTSVTIPSSVTSIGESAFSGCSGLTSVTIPGGVESIGESAFSGCSGLTSITIPDSVTSIGKYTFYGCGSLTSVTIPSSVKSIGENSFSSCTSLTSVTIPACVLGKLSDTFPNSTNLQHVEIADDVTSIDERAFMGCSGLLSVTIPSSVTSISHEAFRGCSGLTSVAIPNSVTSIGDSAFWGCTSLTSVTIPASVTSIGSYAFYDCSSLTSVTIPDSVKEIGWGAFKHCNLSEVSIPADATIAEGDFPSFDSGVKVVRRPSISYANLKGATNTNPATYEEGKALALAAPGAVTGYTFAGWTPAAIMADMTGAQTVTANWTANRYQIVYEANGGSGETVATDCTYDMKAEIAANGFVHAGYVFKGWATEEDGEVVYAPGDKVTNLTPNAGGVVTLYAVWAMELVEGVSFTPSGEIAVAATGAKQVVKISGNGEEWTAATSGGWLKLNSTSGVATDKSIICTIAENAAAESRIGYVYIAGQTLTVSQAGRGATVEESVMADTAGGEVAVAVSVSDETTTWRARSACPWIQVETANGTGSGEVKIRVLPWNKTISRTGTMTIAGQSVVVTQEAAASELSETSAAVVAQGETLSVDVETVESVEWAITGVPEWVTIDGDAERSGSGCATFIVSPNTTFEDRSATILIAGKAFTLTQDAARVEIEGELVRRCDDSGVDSLVVTVRVDVATASWTVKISEEAESVWVFLMSGEEPVTGDGSFELYVAPASEGDALPRTATVTVGNATLRIVQGDGVVVEGVDTPFVIPTSWLEKYYSTQGGTTPDEWQKIAEGAGVKTDASGAALPVWHDYVAGTDPTDAASRFTASVALEDGKPVVSWSPALNGEGVREGVRTYRVWGKESLTDAAWSEVAPDGESSYRFFRVSVEMP